MFRAENKQLKSQLESERKRVTSLEAKLVSAEAANKSLSTRVAAYSETKAVLEDELDDKELEVNKIWKHIFSEQVLRLMIQKAFAIHVIYL